MAVFTWRAIREVWLWTGPQFFNAPIRAYSIHLDSFNWIVLVHVESVWALSILYISISYCFHTPRFMRPSTSQHRASEPEAFLAAWLYGSKYTSCDWACGAPWPHRFLSPISGLHDLMANTCKTIGLELGVDLSDLSQTLPKGYLGFQRKGRTV